jgi:hypothetical protein
LRSNQKLGFEEKCNEVNAQKREKERKRGNEDEAGYLKDLKRNHYAFNEK